MCSKNWISVCCIRVWQSVGFLVPAVCLWSFVSCIVSAFYQIAHLGDDDDEIEFSSAMALEEGETFHFAPRGLKNLMLVDEIENLSPIMACQVYVTVMTTLL